MIKKLIPYLFFLLLFGNAGAQSRDAQWLHAINTHTTPFWNSYSTLMSTSTPYVSAGLPVLFLTAGYLANNENLVSGGYYSLMSLAISTVFTIEMKYIVRRERPYDKYPDCFDLRSGTESTPSFPSLHTSMAFSTATSLTLQWPKWYVAIPSYLWAGSVAYSRMNTGVHYPTDVIGGAIAGAGCAYLTYKLNKWLNRPLNTMSKNTLQWIY